MPPPEDVKLTDISTGHLETDFFTAPNPRLLFLCLIRFHQMEVGGTYVFTVHCNSILMSICSRPRGNFSCFRCVITSTATPGGFFSSSVTGRQNPAAVSYYSGVLFHSPQQKVFWVKGISCLRMYLHIHTWSFFLKPSWRFTQQIVASVLWDHQDSSQNQYEFCWKAFQHLLSQGPVFRFPGQQLLVALLPFS